MIFKPFYRYETGCASYLLGCGTLGKRAGVDPLEGFIDEYVTFAADKGVQITRVLEMHVHADHSNQRRGEEVRA
jgi:glyoxylase-like metal-dependent hydrolase (beta-lactamase superfamily II)